MNRSTRARFVFLLFTMLVASASGTSTAFADPAAILSQAEESWKQDRDQISYETAIENEFFENSSVFFLSQIDRRPGFQKLDDLTGRIPSATDDSELPLMKLPGQIQPGDILALEGDQPMAVVYIGMSSFPQSDEKYPFFIYPYSDGLEKNTFPPALHLGLLTESQREKFTNQFESLADEGREVTWLARRAAGERQPLFSRANFRDREYRVYRHTGEIADSEKDDSVDRDILAAEEVAVDDPAITFRMSKVEIYHYSIDADSLKEAQAILDSDEKRGALMKQELAKIEKNYKKPDGGTFDLKNEISFEDGLFVGFSPASNRIQINATNPNDPDAEITSATFTSRGFILLPEWSGGSAAEKQLWRTTYRKLLDHEITHAKIWKEVWKSWGQQIANKSYPEVVDLLKKASEEEQKRQIEFDKRTNHGLK